MKLHLGLVVAPFVLFSLLLSACATTPTATPPPTPVPATEAPEISTDLKRSVIRNYANGVHISYLQSLKSAQQMDAAIDGFLTSPSASNMQAARQAWLRARDDYNPTEAFRFYGGPIDNDVDGPEGFINAWPLDEAYIDYVAEDPDAGIINKPAEFPVIDADLLLSLNEEGGETNIATGWHAIEFLLWGQDGNPDGPGNRPWQDYTTKSNADRRAIYLAAVSDLLLVHLGQLVDAWDPAVQNNYRAEFLAKNPDDAIKNVITGIGELSRGELAGERMSVAYSERSEEDEQSCFSDNTTADILGDARGIAQVYLGDFGDTSGPGVKDLVAAVDPALADRLEREISNSVTLAARIPPPFDQHLRDGVPNSSPGRMLILETIESLERQTDTLVEASQSIGITLSFS